MKLYNFNQWLRVDESRKRSTRLIIEQVVQGKGTDQYQYKKEGDLYYYAKRSEGKANPKWIQQKNLVGVNSIRQKIFGETTITQEQLNKILSAPTSAAKPAASSSGSTDTPKPGLKKRTDLIGKVLKLDGKEYPSVKDALGTKDGGIFIKFSDRTDGAGQIDGVGGFYYIEDDSLWSIFSWDTAKNNWADLGDGQTGDPRYNKGSISWVDKKPDQAQTVEKPAEAKPAQVQNVEKPAKLGTGLKPRADLIGKTYTRQSKKWKILDAYEIVSGNYGKSKSIIARGESGGSGKIDGIGKYIYFTSETGGSVWTGFNWSTEKNDFESEPNYNDGSTSIE